MVELDKDRMEDLEAKWYFEWGLDEKDSRELDELVSEASRDYSRCIV